MCDLAERLEWQSRTKTAVELLPHVKDVLYDAEDLLDEFNYYELQVKVEGRVILADVVRSKRFTRFDSGFARPNRVRALDPLSVKD
ncbi:hypothetical protein E2562_028666 [Oryza meyeriana var. granulata]|uniref:Disease resistance N-terminal domain-containing protein n=1 Tax=Oryza meyeriana var. granulata TaxID=110450 RepID=A0A6G1BP06_9ORYZ|nr:hypothetical protein E2562_028666 [Oryza meyeriana var. granulata]